MSRRKAYFKEVKPVISAYDRCDKCDLQIRDVQGGRCFWNPNPRAHHRTICKHCFDVWEHERVAGALLWREKYAALQEEAQPRGEGGEGRC